MMTLYAVTDSAWVGKQTLVEQVKDALEGGITFLQLREKSLNQEEFLQEALEIKQLATAYKVPFVINDDIEIAKQMDADGVHVGQDDMSPREVRKILGADKIVGVSVHNIEEAVLAQEAGADYLGLGAIFPTTTKKDAKPINQDFIKEICDSVTIPVVGIGGINESNMNLLYGTHLDGVALVSAIFGAKDIKQETKKLLEMAKRI